MRPEDYGTAACGVCRYRDTVMHHHWCDKGSWAFDPMLGKHRWHDGLCLKKNKHGHCREFEPKQPKQPKRQWWKVWS